MRLAARAIRSEVASIRRSLDSLALSIRRLTPIIIMAARSSADSRKNKRRRLSAKAHASLVLQGRYMGFMRQLKTGQKAQVRRVKAARGVRAAIETSKRLTSG